MMHIIGSEYNPEYEALEVYVSGCTRACPGCHNPEAQAFGKGYTWERWMRMKLYDMVNNPLIKEIWILGGDLLCQERETAEEFIERLRCKLKGTGKKIMIWTGEEDLHKVSEIIRNNIDYIKLGSYRKELGPVTMYYGYDNKKITLASSNQRIVDMLAQ